MYTLNYQRVGRRHTPRLRPGLFALALTLLTLVGAAFYQLPQARATQSELVLNWDHSMIYPGQNNGNPWGPVGEPATVHGGGYPGERLKLLMVGGDTNQNRPDLCAPPSYTPPYAVVVGQVTVPASGSFDATFPIPGGLSQQASVNYQESICAIVASNNAVVSSRDSGPFTVLTENKPSFTISASSAAAGGSIAVTGQNWAPPQPLSITIANCADCGATNVAANITTTSKGLNSGTFDVTIPLPASAQPGNYLVNVSTQNGLLDANHLTGVGVKQLAITAPQVTPTVTASPSPSVTQTATATATKTTANAASTTPSGSSGGGNGALMLILLAIAVVILAIGGVLLYMYAQHGKEGGNAPTNPGAPQPGSGQFQQYNNPQTPFPPGQPGSSPGTGFSSYNQNWQGNAGFGNFQQNQAMPGAGRACTRCGNPLAPNAANCVACGTPVAPYDPNATIPY